MGSFLTARQLELFGLKPIADQKEPWTIAGAIEEKVESIDNDILRAFVENFLEGAVDAITEVGYVVTYSIEDFYRTQKMANRDALGPERGVKVQPDERKPDEFIVITGPQELAKQSIETTLNQHRFIHNRDLGQLVGQPIQDYIRSGVQRRKLTMVFKSKESPPWVAPPGEDYIKEVSYTIPEVEMGLTWNELKVAGRTWMWGACRATANMSNGRQMAVYGATPLRRRKNFGSWPPFQPWTFSPFRSARKAIATLTCESAPLGCIRPTPCCWCDGPTMTTRASPI